QEGSHIGDEYPGTTKRCVRFETIRTGRLSDCRPPLFGPPNARSRHEESLSQIISTILFFDDIPFIVEFSYVGRICCGLFPSVSFPLRAKRSRLFRARRPESLS